MNILRSIARPLLAAPFIVDGVDALVRPSVHVQRSRDLLDVAEPVLDKVGIEVSDEVLTLGSRAMGAAAVVAGLGLACGVAPRSCATVLCALSVPIAVVNASVSIKHRDFGNLSRRIALIGALGIASTDRVGAPSAVWRVNTWKEARRRERAARLESHA